MYFTLYCTSKCKNSEALTITTQSDTHYTQLQRSVQSGGAPAPGAPLLPTPLAYCSLANSKHCLKVGESPGLSDMRILIVVIIQGSYTLA